MNKNLIKNDLLAIDLARGLAALLVFIYHYGIGRVLAETTGYSELNSVALPGAVYAVPLFFAISGYCIHLSQLGQEKKYGSIVFDYKYYFLRRFFRIYPTYFIALLFSCAVMAMEGQKVELGDFVIHLTLLQGFSVKYFNSINLVLWTISVEVMLYLLYPVWYRLRVSLGLSNAVIVGLAVSLASWSVLGFWMFPYSLPEQWFVLNLWGSWLTGCWLAEQMNHSEKQFNRPQWWLLGIIVILVTLAYERYNLWGDRGLILRSSILTIIWIWPLSAALLANKWLEKYCRSGWGIFIKPLQVCGKFSYSLYLLHMPLMYFRNLVWEGISGGIIRSLIYGAGFIGILFCSWLSYQLFEKPFMRYRINFLVNKI